MKTPGLLKLRLFAARYRRALLAVMLAVALISTAGAGWAYANPGETTETDHRYPQTVAGSVETSAVVTGETSVYEQGTELSDRRVYLLNAAPNLTLDAQVDAPDSAAIDQRVVLQYRATRENQVVWEESRVLATGSGDRVQTTVNVSQIRERAGRIQGEFGAAATVDLQLRYVIDYETDRYDGRLNATIPLQFTQQAYIVDGDFAVEETQTTPVTVTREQSPDYAVVGSLAGVGLLSVAGAVILVRRDPRPILEADTVELQRQRYAEWISSGRIPTFSVDQRVEMESLADLVNVAIDSNERVLYDAEQEAYGVLKEGGSLFWYSPSEKGLINLSMEWQTDGEPGDPFGTSNGRFGDEAGSFEEAFDTAFEEAGADADPELDEPTDDHQRVEELPDGGGSSGDESDWSAADGWFTIDEQTDEE